MSGGGRIGVDGRFMSRGCDMRCEFYSFLRGLKVKTVRKEYRTQQEYSSCETTPKALFERLGQQLLNHAAGFTSEEICEILGRFEKLVLIGDSMLRHVIGSINVLVRKDLGYGAVTDWNFSMQEK